MHRSVPTAYDSAAHQFSHHYDQIGAREGDIQLAFALAGGPGQPKVLELGCGNGRDARAITQYTPDYTGIDTSEKMISIAKERVPAGHFERSNALTYAYDGPYDVVFAFAPLRHLNLESVTDVLRKVYNALRAGGVFYISSNYGAKYEPVEQASPVGGTRQIYTYNPDIIYKHAPTGFKPVYQTRDTVDGQEWFEVALQKVR